MNLKKLTNEELDQQLKSLVKRENEVLKYILLHIAEVDRRKMYLEMSYPSLFTYLTKHIGYSNGSAQRRIDAARLSYDVPSVINDIASGTLNLQQVSLVQASIREVQSKKFGDSSKRGDSSKCHVESAVKIKLIDELKNKSNTESQILIAKTLNIKPKLHTKVKHQQDGSVSLEVNLKKSLWEKLEKVRDLASHSLPSGSWDEVIEYAMDLVIRQKTYQEKKPQKKSHELKVPITKVLATKISKVSAEKFFEASTHTTFATDSAAPLAENQPQTHCQVEVDTPKHGKFETHSKGYYQKNHYHVAVENRTLGKNLFESHSQLRYQVAVKSNTESQPKTETQSNTPPRPGTEPKPNTKTPNKTLTPKLKQFILARDRHCQHVDPKSGKKCASTQFLQVDHIHPRWDRGSHAPENLRVLCGAHNRGRYHMRVRG